MKCRNCRAEIIPCVSLCTVAVCVQWVHNDAYDIRTAFAHYCALQRHQRLPHRGFVAQPDDFVWAVKQALEGEVDG